MWFTAKFRLVSSFTASMSRLMAALVRNSDPMLPNAPSFDAAAANSADEALPMGARMIGTSMPRTSHSWVLSIASPARCLGAPPQIGYHRSGSRISSLGSCSHRHPTETMTLRPIVRYPDPRLPLHAQPVTAVDGALRELAAD